MSRAVNYSRSVDAKWKALREADAALHEELRAAYPKDALVTVVHYRGEFIGTVVGHDYYDPRVRVLNHKSGKVGKWAYSQVELVGSSSTGGGDA
ncbi:hypothetical protein [uncultured Pseudacidovorax sp.]|uniref:hypothetical protein n=1 Tax=uncultured Pseudacidovorax sp. TaxID=679313 RepID=UPI0025F6A7EE|nr:hypothetical protein [uncultured Pseudacidovorax sp.]